MPPPRKKDRLQGSLSSMQEQFPPTGTLCGGQTDLPGKSRLDEGAKTATGRVGDCAQTAPTGERRAMGGSGAGKAPHWATAGARGMPGRKNSLRRGGWGLRPRENGGQWGFWCREAPHWAPGGARGIPGAKTAPSGGQDCVQTAPMEERRASGAGWFREGAALGARRGREHVRAQNSPRRGPEAVWMRDMGVTCPGRSV